MTAKKTTKKAAKAKTSDTIRGDRVRKIREERGMTQMQLAARIGSDPPRVSRMELGKSDVLGSAIKKMAVALGVSTDYLFGLTDSPNRNT